MIKNFKWVLIASLAFVACNNDDEVTIDSNSSDGKPLTAGTADVTKYVALGDSYGAGFSDNALFKLAQEGSYANLLANQFVLAGGGEFKTPFMADNIGGLLLGGNVIQGPRLFFNGAAGLAPIPGKPSTEVTTKLTGPFNNLSVPGAKSYHLLAAGYGNVAGVAAGLANPYFARFATSAATTVVADAVAQNPTFFSLWIGGNDVLGYATSGGTGKDQKGNLNPATYAASDITDPSVFASVYSNIVNTMTAKGAKGIVANLPYVTALPFFTTVPYNPATLSATQASDLNNAYDAYNRDLIAAKNAGLITETERLARTINFTTGANGVIMVDEYLTTVNVPGLVLPSLRLTTSGDYIVLSSGGVSTQGFLLQGNGTRFPLTDKWVLSKAEVLEVKAATDAYNATIKTVADAKGLALVDLRPIMDQIAGPGIVLNGYNTTSAFIFGGMFSLDGVHPSPRGYAIISNYFAQAINAKYGSNFKDVNVGQYRILYPESL